jgi:hypothetical protein
MTRPKFLVPLTMTAAVAAAVIAGGNYLLPRTLTSWTWLEARNDPLALADLGLRNDLTPARLERELDAALTTDDIDLAGSFVALAQQQNLSVPPALLARYKAETTPTAETMRAARAFYEGARDGESASGAGLAGVIASDLTGIGDVRDLIHEGQKAQRGEEINNLTLGLAAVGLAVTGATIVSLGMAMPARAGVSTLKVAVKTGRISRPLAITLGRAVSEAVDTRALTVAASAASRLELSSARAAARSAIRPASLTRLRGMAEDVTVIGRKAGVRGAQEALTVARDGGDLRRVARLSESRGLSTRAVLKVLGRGAIALTSSAAILAGWLMAGLSYLWLALLLFLAVTKRITRLIWRRGGRDRTAHTRNIKVVPKREFAV